MNSRALPGEWLRDYRRQTFRLDEQTRLSSAEDAVHFVNERGFVYFWPIKEITLPSLWVAVAGERPVADEHDDPGHVTWRWKDSLLDKRQWHYAKVLRGRATVIALHTLPTFYALSENYGDPAHDYLQLYQDGLLTREAKLIYETLLNEGPQDTVTLRRLIHLSGGPFERGLTELQRDFKILPRGVAETGAWRYSFVYDLVHRYYPELAEQARPIGRQQAREKLVELYFLSVGAATTADVTKLFQWPPRDVERTLESLATAGVIQGGYLVNGRVGTHYIHASLLADR
ncbi:MAG: crosslink repair DNA glycosylase YcaQ family protein [Chloroflexota bacterium]